MTQMEKIIRPKLGLLELAKQLGNVSESPRLLRRPFRLSHAAMA